MRRLLSAATLVAVTGVLVDRQLAGVVALTLVLGCWVMRWGRRPLAPAHGPEPALHPAGFDTEREHLPREYRQAIFERDGWRCRYGCWPSGGNPLEVDHWVPVARGGTNRPQNLVTLCRVHNRAKGKRMPPIDTVAPGEPVGLE